jgi:peptidoglycan/xylan/chitin deacetylase (PgdA/CDA1 family)
MIKIKKIILSAISIFVLVMALFMLDKDDAMQAFSLFEGEDVPYTQGTKKNSGFVALTCNVDLGWESEYVESILETLKQENVKITFNVTGRWAQNNQELLLKIKEEGHEIGNHGHRHLDYAKLTYEENLEQIQTSKKIIEDIIQEETKFFQAPAGSFGIGTMKAAKDLNYIPFKWDIDTIDWKYREEPDVIIKRIESKPMGDSSIILMHPTNATTECLGEIIKIIREKGYEAGRLSDVFE